MKLTLYNNSSQPNVINKNLKKIIEKDIILKASTSIYQPNLLFLKDKSINWDNVNYAKLFDRFYFVDTETQQNGKIVLLIMKEDVLETYKDDILNSEADIIEKSTVGNTGNVPTSKDVETKIFKSDTKLPKTDSVIMVTVASKGEE